MPNGDDLESQVRGMTPWELYNYKRELVLKVKSMRPENRDAFLSRIETIPELSDISSGMGRLLPTQRQELAPTVTQPQPPAVTEPEMADIPLWQKGIETALYPFTAFGAMHRENIRGLIETAKLYKEDPWAAATRELEWESPIEKLKEIAPSGEVYKGFREAPLGEQLLYEAPMWATIPTAIGLRAGLAPAATRPGLAGVVPKVARAGLAPIAGAEVAIGAGLKYGIGLPLKYGVAKPIELATRKLFEKALDLGLDVWLLKQGVRAPYGNKVIEFFLEKNNRWLFQKAQENWLKRLAEKKGTKYAANKAAADTVKEAEPLLLQAAKDAGVGVKPTIEPMITPPPVKPLVEPMVRGKKLWEMTDDELLKVVDLDIKARVVRYPKGGRIISTYPKELNYKEGLDVFRQTAKKEGLEVAPLVISKAVPEVSVVRPPIAEVPKPAIERVVTPVTSQQTEQIWGVGLDKALITARGKFNPSFRRLLISQTGQAGTVKTTKALLADMTSEEAKTFLEALRRLPEPTMKGRVKVPPSIPTITKVTTENFFNIQFGEPTPIKYFTSQTYYAQKLGVKPLTEPLELAKQRLDLEFPAWEKAVDLKINEVNKIWGVRLGEQLAAKIKHTPTRAVVELRNLLDKYETLPADLVAKMPFEQVKLFSWFRNVSRTIINGENQVRRLLGLEEIPYREAYVRHVPDAMAQEILLGNHPLPEALKYWATRIVGKKIFNPMEMQRQLSVDLAEYFTRDLAYATKSMIWTGLKEIHLSQPLRSFSEQMGAFTKDLKEWKHLFPEEFGRFQKINVLPASTRRWVTDYVNQVIKGQQTFFDEEINRIVARTGFAGLMDKVLKPFGRTLGIRPVTDLTQLAGRLTILSVMTPRPGLLKMIIRNLFQHTQDMALYGIKNLAKGYYPATGNLEKLLDKSLFLKGYTGFEQLPVALQGRIEKLALYPYGMSAIFNAKTAMKTAYRFTETLIKAQKNKEFGWADPQRTYKEAKDFLYPSEEALLLKEMEFGAGATQYQYISMGMPQIFRTKTLIAFTRLQSWWMNHFFRFHREAMYRFFRGEPSYATDFERTYGRRLKLPWSSRVNYLKYLVLGGAILTGMGYTTSYLLGALPYNLSPVGQFVMGIWQYTGADTDWQRARAKSQIFNSWRAIVPGALATKELEDIWTGKKQLWQIFFYGKEEAGPPPHLPSWGIPALEAKTPHEQIEDKVWDKYPSDLRSISEKIKELEKTDPQAARKLQMQHPQILAARRAIALEKSRLKQQEQLEERRRQLQGG